MRPFLHRLALSAVTGVVFVYWSELAFWARPYAGTSLAEMAPTTLAYALAAYLFLAAISAFRASTAATVFLCGALFGWFVEGVIVQTMVEDLPLSISFTGLAWHASITVLLGWWLIPRWLSQGLVRRLAGWSAVIGLVYGWWAMTWWVEAPPPSPVINFAAYVFRTTLILIGAYALAAQLQLDRFSPSRFEWAVLTLLITAYFLLVTVPTAPISLLVIPPLTGLVLVALQRGLRRGPSDDPVTPPRGRLQVTSLAALLVIPLTATAVYAFGHTAGLRFPTGIVLYLFSTPLGFALVGWSLWRAFRRHRGFRTLPETSNGR